MTPVKYECDANNLRGTLTGSKILLTEKSTNGALVTPTPSLWGGYSGPRGRGLGHRTTGVTTPRLLAIASVIHRSSRGTSCHKYEHGTFEQTSF